MCVRNVKPPAIYEDVAFCAKKEMQFSGTVLTCPASILVVLLSAFTADILSVCGQDALGATLGEEEDGGGGEWGKCG